MLTLYEQYALASRSTPDVVMRQCADIWMTEDGRVYPVADMTINQLQGCLGILIVCELTDLPGFTAQEKQFKHEFRKAYSDGEVEKASALMAQRRQASLGLLAQHFPIVPTILARLNRLYVAWEEAVDERIAVAIDQAVRDDFIHAVDRTVETILHA